MKQENNGTRLFIFLLTTIIYLFTKWLVFKGFSGTDDLHYASLASNVLNGTYNPFQKEDIFSGRVGLIYVQAVIYYLGGINGFTTQIASLLITVLCCYLTLFKLDKIKHYGTALIVCCLFYFNPVLNEGTLGIMPDAFIMLAVILIILLWKKNKIETNSKKFFFNNITISAITISALFFKESAIIFIPLIIGLGIYERKHNGFKAMSIVLTSFFTGIIFCGLGYYFYTNDFFFRVHQIQQSDYTNPCNFALQSLFKQAERLTYGVWKGFIISGFFQAVLTALLIGYGFYQKILLKKSIPLNALCFILLVVLGLYFPFSVKGYQPLCYNARHFIFLYPFAVVIVALYLEQAFEGNTLLLKFLVVCFLLLLGVSIISTGNKWYWMIYGLFAACLIFFTFIKKGIFYKLRYLAFAFIVWLYMAYQLFFQNSNWYKNSQELNHQINSQYYYFPEHVNMMNWKFLHQFNTTIHHYNLEPKAFKLFAPYYEKPDTEFHPGWFILNSAFTERSPNYLLAIDKLENKGFFKDQKTIGDMKAFFITDANQLSLLESLTAIDYVTVNGCCN